MAIEEVRSQQWTDRIEELVHRAESVEDQKLRSIAVDLLRAVLDFHAAGLERVMEIAAGSGPAGKEVIDRMAADDLAGSLLLLHGLHPDDLETRLNRTIERLQSSFSSRGASVSLIAIEEDSVRLRFDAARPWSGAPVKATIEAAVYQAAPEIASVIVEGLQEPPEPNFVPLSNLMAGARL
ncbi:MAG TPA: hypothetical protein VLI55_15225 [Bryobacteraceae bacterium]|nr:hypothetical protein [Bryobacteraceae bacterium]